MDVVDGPSKYSRTVNGVPSSGHHIDIALFTDWQGRPQRRHIRIVGNELHITGSPRTAQDGRTFSSELVWIRQADR